MMQRLRGDLPAAEAPALEGHLKACASCREEIEAFGEIFALTAMDRDAALPDTERLLASSLDALPRRRPVLRAAVLVIALSLLGVLALKFFDRKSPAVTEHLVLVQGGRFDMGDPFREGRRDEVPVHPVTLADFYLAKYEVTLEAFSAFMEETGYTTSSENPVDREAQEKIMKRLEEKERFDEEAYRLAMELISYGGCYKWDPDTEAFEYLLDCNWRTPHFDQGRRDPVVCVSWIDAINFCNWRSRKAGLAEAYDLETGALLDRNGEVTTDVTRVEGFRLPTEAEWEYAAREGGRTVRFGNGRNLALAEEINFNASRGGFDYARTGVYRKRTLPVGSFAPNALGLHDMSGNAWEWCTDCYQPYTDDKRANPIQVRGDRRVVRGGRWGGDAQGARVFARDHFEPNNRCNNSGFRLARSK
jgi:formylglycine-generating enzyme required for sulfatase activity